MAQTFLDFGIHLVIENRVTEAALYLAKSAELAEQAGGARATLGLALLNLSNVQVMQDPAAAAATARRCLPRFRRVGDRALLGHGTVNLAMALLPRPVGRDR